MYNNFMVLRKEREKRKIYEMTPYIQTYEIMNKWFRSF